LCKRHKYKIQEFEQIPKKEKKKSTPRYIINLQKLKKKIESTEREKIAIVEAQ
jgi:ribosomal protein S30